jgi:nucleoid DNA-binding protein
MDADGNDILDSRALIDALALELGLPRRKVSQVLTSLASNAASALKAGKKVRIAGLGVLRVREKVGGAAASGSQKRVILVPGKQLKAAVEG